MPTPFNIPIIYLLLWKLTCFSLICNLNLQYKIETEQENDET